MKKIIKLVVFISLALMLVACSGGSGSNGGNSGGGSGKKGIANDSDVLALHFTAPSEYAEVERFCEKTVDGKLIEKDIVYNFENGESVTYAVMPGNKLSDLTNVDNLEQYEVNGFKVYRYDSGNDMMAFIQNGDDLYAIDRYMIEVDDGTALKEIVSGVSFTKNTTTTTDDPSFEELNYELDKDHNLYETLSRIVEDSQGNQTEKGVSWRYGNESDTDFTFVIRVYRNKTFDDVLNADSTYEEVVYNGIPYNALVNSSGDPSYAFYTQHSDDVYLIRNNGDDSGWFISRSEESYTCFEKFISSISFK